jgi:hypothetical protein
MTAPMPGKTEAGTRIALAAADGRGGFGAYLAVPAR